MCLHVLTVRNAEQEILMRQRMAEGKDVKKRMHVMKEGKRVQRGAVAPYLISGTHDAADEKTAKSVRPFCPI